MKELTFKQIRDYVGIVCNSKEEFNKGYYYYNDEGYQDTFKITFNILPYPSSEDVLETLEIDLHEVYKFYKK